jgi:hypothetical protein
MGASMPGAMARTVRVAPPGSAPRSGRGGRRFKSCHSDQHLAEIPTSTGTDCGTVSSDAHAIASFELLAATPGCYSCRCGRKAEENLSGAQRR